MVTFLNASSCLETEGKRALGVCPRGLSSGEAFRDVYFAAPSPSLPLPSRDVQMEAGGDTAAPAPGDAEDLEDTRLPGEEAGDGGGVQEDPTESEDRSLEETGMSFSSLYIRKNE